MQFLPDINTSIGAAVTLARQGWLVDGQMVPCFASQTKGRERGFLGVLTQAVIGTRP